MKHLVIASAKPYSSQEKKQKRLLRKGAKTMGLEAVWLKNGKEVFGVDPVLEIKGNTNDPNSVAVFNGYYWYTTADVAEGADEFLIRPRKEQK